MKTILIITAAVMAAAALALYPDQTPKDELHIAYSANIGHVIPIAGIKEGFFARDLQGTGIQARVFDSGPQIIESMFAGSIDLAYVGPGPAINGHLNSQHGIKVLAGAASGGASFVVHPDSKIATASDFAQKKIAAPQIGNTQDVSLRNYLQENGLSPAEKGGSVTIYNIPNPDIYTLFVKGEVDGAWVAEPWATILEAELNGKRLFHEEELWDGREFASVLLVAEADYIRENPQTVSRFIASHHDTAAWINEDPARARNVFNGFLEDHLGRPLPDGIVDTALTNIQITGRLLPESIDEFARQADSLGYLGRDGYDTGEIYLNSTGGIP